MKKILYPIFLKLSSKMTDNFWRYVYEDLSYGKTPYGLYIQDEYLVCYIKNKEFSYRINDSTEESLEELHVLLKKRAGILSEKDKIEDRETLLNEKIEQTKSIHKKTYRDNLIQNYIIRQGKKYNIKTDVLKNLLSFLSNAFLFKVISLQDIQFKLDRIESIQGIIFKKNKILIQHDLFSNIHNTSIVEDELRKQNVLELWGQFLNGIEY